MLTAWRVVVGPADEADLGVSLHQTCRSSVRQVDPKRPFSQPALIVCCIALVQPLPAQVTSPNAELKVFAIKN